MITDAQYHLLKREFLKCGNVKIASAKSGMSEKTGRKFLKKNKLPSELKKPRTWRTRKNPFELAEHIVVEMLEINPGLEAKTIFAYLNSSHGFNFQEGQLRTLQRFVSNWRVTEGPEKEIFFDQIHTPGDLGAGDFTDMNKLNITINRVPFDHKIFHFVLTYSNWETGSICFSESFESLSEGLQNAFWGLGAVPKRYITDRLTAAVNNFNEVGTFQNKYQELLDYYGVKGEMINPESPNENGDSEQSHHRFKKAVSQGLMLRGSNDFKSRECYEEFLQTIFNQLNQSRKERLKEEALVMQALPEKRIDACSQYDVSVRKNSTISVKHKVYSVPSRLIGKRIRVNLYPDHLELMFNQKLIEKIPRIKGGRNARIDYRHIIGSLIKKPGAFQNYKYREELFPSLQFRMAYDQLHIHGKSGVKDYLRILQLAAINGEEQVQKALMLSAIEKEITLENVKENIEIADTFDLTGMTESGEADLGVYDSLITPGES